MKLRFLGQTYSHSNSQVKTITSEITGQFLGQKYILRRPLPLFKSQSQSQLGLRKYRGVSYGA